MNVDVIIRHNDIGLRYVSFCRGENKIICSDSENVGFCVNATQFVGSLNFLFLCMTLLHQFQLVNTEIVGSKVVVSTQMIRTLNQNDGKQQKSA